MIGHYTFTRKWRFHSSCETSRRNSHHCPSWASWLMIKWVEWGLKHRAWAPREFSRSPLYRLYFCFNRYSNNAFSHKNILHWAFGSLCGGQGVNRCAIDIVAEFYFQRFAWYGDLGNQRGFQHSRFALSKWSKHGHLSLVIHGHDPPLEINIFMDIPLIRIRRRPWCT